MPDGSDVIYLHDGSFEGLLTAVFEAYARRPAPAAIEAPGCQQRLGARYAEIPCDPVKANRVEAGIRRKIGGEDYDLLWTAFLSDDEKKSDKIYQYIRLGLEIGPKIHYRLADSRVLAVQKLAGLVGREAGMLRQFVRFARMEGGVFYGAITPQYPVLPLIMPHFAERFQVQPFILHDKTHGQAGVFDTREWVIASTEGLALPDSTADEAFYRRLWKTFYDTVAIKERTNYNLRRNHMPKKYWKNMVEMQPSPEELFPSRFADGGKLPETPAPRSAEVERLPERETGRSADG